MTNFYDNKSELFQALREFDDYIEEHVDTDNHGTEILNRVYRLTGLDVEYFGLPKGYIGDWFIKGVMRSINKEVTFQYCGGCYRVELEDVNGTKYIKYKGEIDYTKTPIRIRRVGDELPDGVHWVKVNMTVIHKEVE